MERVSARASWRAPQPRLTPFPRRGDDIADSEWDGSDSVCDALDGVCEDLPESRIVVEDGAEDGEASACDGVGDVGACGVVFDAYDGAKGQSRELQARSGAGQTRLTMRTKFGEIELAGVRENLSREG